MDNQKNKGAVSSGKQSQKENIKVVIRVRPLNSKEKRENSKIIVNLPEEDQQTIFINNYGKGGDLKQPQKYNFDKIYGFEAQQKDIFENIGKPFTLSVMEGYNACIFCYGQTGAGKTYTMQGDLSNVHSEHKGLQIRVFEYLFSLFQEIKSQQKEAEFLVAASYFEIYNEQILDLLSSTGTILSVREDIKTGVYIEGLQEQPIESVQDAIGLLNLGARNRHTGHTDMNSESSRSHSVFTLHIESKQQLKNSVNVVKNSRMNFVDLAGSERQQSTNAVGNRLKEANNINSSLTVLGHCINSLVEQSQGKNRHIPYRNSKLTFILKDSLGGNSKTCIIAAISPSQLAYQETLSTLKFAGRAKMIQNKTSINEESSGSNDILKKEIQNLRQQLQQSIQQIQDLKLNQSNIKQEEDQNNEKLIEYQNKEIINNINVLQINKMQEAFLQLESSELLLESELTKRDEHIQQLLFQIEQYQKNEINYRLIINLYQQRFHRRISQTDNEELKKEYEELIKDSNLQNGINEQTIKQEQDLNIKLNALELEEQQMYRFQQIIDNKDLAINQLSEINNILQEYKESDIEIPTSKLSVIQELQNNIEQVQNLNNSIQEQTIVIQQSNFLNQNNENKDGYNTPAKKFKQNFYNQFQQSITPPKINFFNPNMVMNSEDKLNKLSVGSINSDDDLLNFNSTFKINRKNLEGDVECRVRKCIDNQEQLKVLKDQQEKQKEEIEKQNNKNKSLEKQIEDIKTQLLKAQAEIACNMDASMLMPPNMMNQTFLDFQDQYKEKENYEQMSLKNEDLSKQNKELQTKQEQLENQNKELRQLEVTFCKQKETFNKQIESLQNKIKNYELKISENIAEKANEKAQLLSEKEQLQQQNYDLIYEKDSLNEEYQTLYTTFNKIEAENKELVELHHKDRKEKNVLLEQNMELQKENEKLEKQYQNFKEEVKHLDLKPEINQSFQCQINEIDELKKYNSDYKKEILSLFDQNKVLRENSSNLYQELQESQRSLNMYKESFIDLRNKYNMCKKDYDDLLFQNDKLQAEHMNIQAEYNLSYGTKQSLQQDLQQVRQILQKTKAEKAFAFDQVTTLKSEIKEVRQALLDQIAKTDKEKEQQKIIVEKMNEANQKAETLAQNSQQFMDIFRQKQLELEQTKRLTGIEIKTKQEMEEKMLRTEKLMSIEKKRVESYEEDVKKLESDNQKSIDEIKRIKKKYKKLKQKKQKNMDIINAYEWDIQSHQLRIEDLIEHIDYIEVFMKDIDENMQQSMNNYVCTQSDKYKEKFNQENDKSLNLIAKQVKEIQQLKDNLSSAEKKCLQLQQEVDKLNQMKYQSAVDNQRAQELQNQKLQYEEKLQNSQIQIKKCNQIIQSVTDDFNKKCYTVSFIGQLIKETYFVIMQNQNNPYKLFSESTKKLFGIMEEIKKSDLSFNYDSIKRTQSTAIEQNITANKTKNTKFHNSINSNINMYDNNNNQIINNNNNQNNQNTINNNKIQSDIQNQTQIITQNTIDNNTNTNTNSQLINSNIKQEDQNINNNINNIVVNTQDTSKTVEQENLNNTNNGVEKIQEINNNQEKKQKNINIVENKSNIKQEDVQNDFNTPQKKEQQKQIQQMNNDDKQIEKQQINNTNTNNINIVTEQQNIKQNQQNNEQQQQKQQQQQPNSEEKFNKQGNSSNKRKTMQDFLKDQEDDQGINSTQYNQQQNQNVNNHAQYLQRQQQSGQKTKLNSLNIKRKMIQDLMNEDSDDDKNLPIKKFQKFN